MSDLKTTTLNSTHRRMGAKMVDFGGYEMPVSYGSQIEEHQAVRTHCGLFDVAARIARHSASDFDTFQLRTMFSKALAV